PVCKHTNKVVKSGKPRLRLYAIEYFCPVCKKRSYKKVDMFDIKLYEKASADYKNEQDLLPIPTQKIPFGLKTQELLNHQMFFFKDLFNERQLLILGRLYREILDIKDPNIREFFILIFSASLEYNNLLCEYHRNNHYIYNLFRKHGFPATPNPVENNVWGTKFGTGTFKNFFSKTVKIKRYCDEPYEVKVENEKNVKYPMKNLIEAQIVNSFEDLMAESGDKSVFLYCNSSENIPVPDKVVDLVVTDPPYFDNVMYGELSDFYYVWLRLGLKYDYEYFKSDYTPKEDEIVKNIKIGKGDDDYRIRLTSVFKDCNRILKDEGLFIFTFHHKQIKAWEVLLQSLIESDFYISQVYPVRSEMKTSTQIRGVKSVSFDIIFVCRKKGQAEDVFHLDGIEWKSIVEENVERQVSAFHDGNNVNYSLEDQLVLKIGLILKNITQNYPEIKENGKEISLSRIFELLSSYLQV
ncbi:MAG: DNA methyltransferase, partial [Candidatus Hodarchaeales archaeon]